MPLEVDEASAPLDAARLSALCRDVLLGVRYRAPQPENVAWSSEESVHAAHWVSGMFLAGKTHWPRSGSVAEQLVSLEHALE